MEQHTDTEVRERATLSMSREQVRDRLRSVALFEGMEGSDLDRILGISESVLVEAGEAVFEEGERGDHFFIIVRGEIELRKKSGTGAKKLAVLRAGQAFGEMALLNQTPRSASAYALVDTYMLSVSRAAFGQILGGDTLAVRLLRNLSRALWATSVRLASKQAQHLRNDTPHEALAEFNRLLRSRLLPRVTPRVSGFDLTAATVAPRQGPGASAWDWFLLTDGRPVFLVMRAVRADVFSAQRLAALRSVLRTLAEQPQLSLGMLMTRANEGLRSGWIDGLSGPVACAMIALAQGAAEVAAAGDPCMLVARARGDVEDLANRAPLLGGPEDHKYESKSLVLGNRDRAVLLSDRPANVVRLVTAVVAEGYTSSSRDALNKLFERVSQSEPNRADMTGAVISRTKPLVS